LASLGRECQQLPHDRVIIAHTCGTETQGGRSAQLANVLWEKNTSVKAQA
jgi:hypothetical protein